MNSDENVPQPTPQLDAIASKVHAEASHEADFHGARVTTIVLAPDGAFRIKAHGINVTEMLGLLYRTLRAYEKHCFDGAVIRPVVPGPAEMGRLADAFVEHERVGWAHSRGQMNDIHEKATFEAPLEQLGEDTAPGDLWRVDRIEGGAVTLRRIRMVFTVGGGGGAGVDARGRGPVRFEASPLSRLMRGEDPGVPEPEGGAMAYTAPVDPDHALLEAALEFRRTALLARGTEEPSAEWQAFDAARVVFYNAADAELARRAGC